MKSRRGTKIMHLMEQNLARAQMRGRLGEAQQQRGRRQRAAVRMSRKAERAAAKAKLALARAL